MNKYYAFISLDMVMPDQVQSMVKLQDGVAGWRYQPEKHTLDLLFETTIETEKGRLDAISAGQKIYLVLDSQRTAFHLPTHESILEEIADAAAALIDNAFSTEDVFNPSEYVVSADDLALLSRRLEDLAKFDEEAAH